MSVETQLGRLPERPVAVCSLVSTPLADAIAQAYGCRMVRVLTGFKYIGQEIEKLEQQLVKSVIKNDRTLTDAINDAVIRKRQAYVEAEREYRKLADAIAQSVERRENMMLVIRNIRSWAVNYKLLKPEE